MPFNPNLPAENSPIVSLELRNQFNGLKSLLDAVLPVGFCGAFLKSLTNVAALPGTWLECNGQVVSDAASPLNGVTLPDLNGAQGGAPSFLRGATTSGGTGGSESHSHGVNLNVNGGTAQMGTDYTLFPPGLYNTEAAPNLPTYYEVVWVIKVKG